MAQDKKNKQCINERNEAIDILRIVSMLMIISLHFFSYNPSVSEIKLFSCSGVIKQILHSIFLISVNCYILISGYYLFKFKFSLVKLLKIITEVWTYSIFFYVAFWKLGIIEPSIKEALFAMLPILTRQYWFVTSYIGVYLLSPILREVIGNMSRKVHALSIFIGFCLFVVYYNCFFFCDNLNFGGSTGIVWFIYLYICASYIKKYNIGKEEKNVRNYIISVVVSLASQIPFIVMYLVTKKEIFLKGSTIFDSVYNSIFVFISSILFFIIFTNLNLCIKSKKIKKIILILSQSSFAVYLVHENKYVRSFLWENISFQLNENIFIFLGYWLATIIFIYLIGTIIDFVRQKLEKITFDKFTVIINRKEKRIRLQIDKIVNNYTKINE